MAQPIVYIDTPAIRKGKLEELKESMNDLAAFVERNMPRVISYGFYLNDDQTEMRVAAVHPDSASLELHINKGRDEFRKFASLIDLLKIEVYGSISDTVLEQLERKAEMLGKGSVEVHEFCEGFSR